jgi:hypothetical protein
MALYGVDKGWDTFLRNEGSPGGCKRSDERDAYATAEQQIPKSSLKISCNYVQVNISSEHGRRTGDANEQSRTLQGPSRRTP